MAHIYYSYRASVENLAKGDQNDLRIKPEHHEMASKKRSGHVRNARASSKSTRNTEEYNLNGRNPHGGTKRKALGSLFEACKVSKQVVAFVQ